MALTIFLFASWTTGSLMHKQSRESTQQCLHRTTPSPLAAQPSLKQQSHKHAAPRPGAPTYGLPFDRVMHLLMLPTGVDAGARGPSSVRREYPAPSGVGGARPCLHRVPETSPLSSART